MIKVPLTTLALADFQRRLCSLRAIDVQTEEAIADLSATLDEWMAREPIPQPEEPILLRRRS